MGPGGTDIALGDQRYFVKETAAIDFQTRVVRVGANGISAVSQNGSEIIKTKVRFHSSSLSK